MRGLYLLIAATVLLVGCQPKPKPVAITPRPLPKRIAPPPPPPVEDLSKIIDRLDDGVVYIITHNVLGQETGFGSGFVIDKSGLVMTNYHVVRNGATLTMQTRDGKPLEVAGYRGVDRQRDIALLQIKDPPEGLETFTFAKPDQLRAGDEVVAIGHPQGFRFTTTTGIVSAIRKTADLPKDYRQTLQSTPDTLWIQTSTAISSGSSGGPLLNRRGEVMGINTWVATQGSNLGFATHLQHLLALRDSAGEVQALPVKRSQAYLDVGDTEVARVVMDFNQEMGKFLNDSAAKARNPLGGLFGGAPKSPAPKYIAKLWQVAETQRKSNTALEALASIASVAAFDADKTDKEVKQALERVREDHLADPKLDKLLLAMRTIPSNTVHDFLREIAQTHTDRDIQGIAWLALANCLLKSNNKPNQEPGLYDLEIADALAKAGSDFGDIDVDGKTIKEMTEKLHFYVTGLVPGRSLPTLAGKDIDGTEIDLASYRGKVVMLDFWVDWCPYCREMYAQEHELVTRHKNRPFAIVGVNSDQEARYRQLRNSRAVAWPSIFNGPEGEITEKWNVHSYPTMYLVDRHGVIRTTQIVKGAPLDAAIDQLLEAPYFAWPENLISQRSSWYYYDEPSTPPADWTSETFNETAWKQASAPFGYGYFNEATRIDHGGNPREKRLAAYFRRKFNVPDAAAVRDLVLSLKCDDGAAIYLNGQEVARSLLPPSKDGAEPRAANSRYEIARSDRVVTIDPKLLKTGDNVLAVEVRQESPNSPDMFFELSLSTNVVDAMLLRANTGPAEAKPDAVQALGYLGPVAAASVSALETLLTHEDALVRTHALEALLQIDPTKFADGKLPEAKNDEEKRFRLYACARLNNEAWRHCLPGGLTTAEYDAALRSATTAVRLQPDNKAAIGTRALTYYRCGKFAEALADIQVCTAGRAHPSDLLIQAMIHHAEQRPAEAKTSMDKARTLSKATSFANDLDLKVLLAEAETLFSETKPAVEAAAAN